MRAIQVVESTEFNRAPRVRPPLPFGEVEIPAPPSMPRKTSTNWFLILLPLLGMGLFIGVMAFANSNLTMVLGSAALMMTSFVSSIVTAVNQKKNTDRDRASRTKAYHEALARVQEQLENARGEQQQAAARVNPDPQACMRLALGRDPALWERRPQDDDFLALRAGVGEVPTTLQIKRHKPPAVMTDEHDPKLHQEAVSLGDVYSTVPAIPITVNLAEAGVLGIAGPPALQHGVLRALLTALAAHHSPDEVKLAAFLPPGKTEEWTWMRWLPHVHARAGGLSRWIASGEADFKHVANTLSMEWNQRKLRSDYSRSDKDLPLPRYVVLVADPNALKQAAVSQVLAEGTKFGAYAIVLGPDRPHLPKQCGAVIELDLDGSGKVIFVGQERAPVLFTPDKPDLELVDRLARGLSPVFPTREVAADSLPDSIRLLELHGAARVEDLPVWENWQKNEIFSGVEAPIGVRVGGHPIVLNLWENIHGPHGLLAGATRSGKSELLRTLVSSLAVQYHPHDLVFTLIDFKGGGLTKDLDQLPHVVGTATNLEPGLPERALEAIRAELLRREALLRGRHIRDYQKAWHAGEEKQPLPRMIVIVDEFAELAEEKPDMLDSLVSAARVGGSLGVNLILATQKPAGVVKGQIWSNSRFRICLRVETAEDSNDMLKRPDAKDLSHPGRGYLQVGDNEVYELIQVARSEATYSAGRAVITDQLTISRVRSNGQRETLWPKVDPDAATVIQQASTTDLQAVIAYINQVAEAHHVEKLPGPWLPMLPNQVSITALRHQYAETGWDGNSAWEKMDRWLNPMVGLLDDTTRQQQPPLRVNLGERGHLYVCGGSRTGKTAFLRTLAAGLVLDHSPEEVNLYLLDYGGRALDLFEELPHVGAVLHPGDEEVVERLFLWLEEEIDRRSRLLGESGGLKAYRKQKNAEKIPGIVVMVDNLPALIEACDQTPEVLQRLARSGHRVGVHLVLAADRASVLRDAVMTNISMRLAFHLKDRANYAFVLGKNPPFEIPERPGTGAWLGEQMYLCQSAALDADLGDGSGAEAFRAQLREMNATWKGVRAMKMRELPQVVPLDDVLQAWPDRPDNAKDCLATAVGLDALRLEPVVLDLARTGPHFMIAGQGQSGKSSALRTMLQSLAEVYTPDQVQFYLMDCLQPELADLKKLPHTAGYALSEDDKHQLVSDLSDILRERSDSGTWEGPQLVLAVDDYDFLESISIKDQLQTWARRARVIGFHLLIAANASEMRTGFDDLRTQVKNSRTGLLLTNANEDGQIFNVRIPPAGEAFPPGRGYLLRRGQLELVQWAF